MDGVQCEQSASSSGASGKISVDENEKMEIDIETPHEELISMAEEKKLEGNNEYSKGNYSEALSLYTEAIGYNGNIASYYGNRAAVLLMLNRYQEAVDDAKKSVTLDPAFVKGYIREAKGYLALGDFFHATLALNKAKEIQPNNSQITTELQATHTVQRFSEEADKDYEKADYRRVLFCMDRALHYATACKRFKVLRAEVLALLGRLQEAQEAANSVIRLDSMNADAIYVRGLCLYYEDHIDKAFQHFQQVLRLAPDHQKAKVVFKKAKQLIQKKEQGNQSFKSHKLDEALQMYTEALSIDPNNKFTNAKLYCNRAAVFTKLKKFDEAISDCTKAISLDETYEKAYLRRAKCYMDMEQYEEAVRDYEFLTKNNSSNREYKNLLKESKLELKKSKRKDYYKILNLTKTATDDDIKKAYKKLALVHHPDRHSNTSPEEKKEHEKKFKEVGEAYAILSDPKKKARYDSGQDLDDAGGFGDIDPETIFQTFFGGPGGMMFNLGGMGGGQHFQFQFG